LLVTQTSSARKRNGGQSPGPGGADCSSYRGPVAPLPQECAQPQRGTADVVGDIGVQHAAGAADLIAVSRRKPERVTGQSQAGASPNGSAP
jgi:hypothetical protein